MSASDKKKLRKEQESQMLTARQRQEQAEAKKLKTYTITFIVIMAVVVSAALGYLAYKGITNSGIIEKNTVAATINGQKINSVEMNYYYQDAIGRLYEDAYASFSSYYALYFESIGLDMTKPLNEQSNPSTGETWADYFLNSALEQAKFDYTFAALAEKEGFALPADAQANIDSQLANLELNAQLARFSNPKNYLAQVYCPGANVDSYKAYLTRSALADAYCTHYYDELSIDQTAIDEHVKGKENNYNSYDYSYVYVNYDAFLAEDVDSTTATTEQKDAAAAEAKKLAEELLALGNLDDIRDKVNEIEGSEIVVKDVTAQLHTSVPTTLLSDWLVSADRQPGEIGLVANAKDDETVAYGYYVVCFTKKNDNTGKMSNVRHLLVEFEGGEEDEISGEINHTAAEMDAARAEANELLQQWRDGEATEASFGALVKKHTDDTASAENGGLYEDIHAASKYVPNFLAWSIDPARQVGDVEIVETEYGCHIMYFSGYSEQSYRDLMVTEELKAEKYDAWYDSAMETATANTENLSKLPMTKPIAS